MTKPTAQALTQFKGISGIHTNTANVVKDYVNMVPLGDSVATRHGFDVSRREPLSHGSTYWFPTGTVYAISGTTFSTIAKVVKTVAIEQFAEDNRVYRLNLIKGDAWGSNYALAFEVWAPGDPAGVTSTSFVELAYYSSTLIEYGRNNVSKFIRNTLPGTTSYQETFVSFGGFLFMVSVEGRVRLIPTPAMEDVIMENATTTADYEKLSQYLSYLPYMLGSTYMSSDPTLREELDELQEQVYTKVASVNYDLAWLDNRLLLLDRLNNRIYYSCQDPAQFFRVADADARNKYDAGNTKWFDCENGFSNLWEGSFTNAQTNEIMQHIESHGNILIVVCNTCSYIVQATGVSSLPFEWSTNSVIPVGGIKPLVSGSLAFIFGTTAVGTPSLITVSLDGDVNNVMSSDVARRLGTPLKLSYLENHGLHHILCHYVDPSVVDTTDACRAYAYCVDNKLWWRFESPTEIDRMVRFYNATNNRPTTIALFDEQYICKNGSTKLSLQLSGADENYCQGYRINLTSWSAQSRNSPTQETEGDYTVMYSECPIVDFRLTTPYPIIPYMYTQTPNEESNVDLYRDGGYISYKLNELGQTFAQRLVLSSVGVRLDTGREGTEFTEVAGEVLSLTPVTKDAPGESITLSVSFDRGNSFNTPKSRNLATTSSQRNDREIVWRGLGSGNSMCLSITYDSKNPTQIYAIDYSLV